MNKKDLLLIYTDGGCSVNKGQENPIRYGFIAVMQGRKKPIMKYYHEPKTKGTSNIAEFLGLLSALKWAKKYEFRFVKILTDSNVLIWWVRQSFERFMRGSEKTDLHIKIKNEVDELKRYFEHFEIEQIPREQNLAGKMLEEKEKKDEFIFATSYFGEIKLRLPLQFYRCKKCDGQIVWGKTERGAYIPFEKSGDEYVSHLSRCKNRNFVIINK